MNANCPYCNASVEVVLSHADCTNHRDVIVRFSCDTGEYPERVFNPFIWLIVYMNDTIYTIKCYHKFDHDRIEEWQVDGDSRKYIRTVVRLNHPIQNLTPENAHDILQTILNFL